MCSYIDFLIPLFVLSIHFFMFTFLTLGFIRDFKTFTPVVSMHHPVNYSMYRPHYKSLKTLQGKGGIPSLIPLVNPRRFCLFISFSMMLTCFFYFSIFREGGCIDSKCTVKLICCQHFYFSFSLLLFFSDLSLY